MVRQYYAKPISDVTPCADTEAATELVLDFMRGVNLVAAAEAVSFARYLNVDLTQFYGLVSQAAGASKSFIQQGLEMIEGRIGDKAPAGSPTVDQVAAKLEVVVQKARDLYCPLHLGNAALNVLFEYGRPRSISLAVLVDRPGRQLPIQADYAGAHLDVPDHQRIKLRGPDALSLVIQEPEHG